MSDPTRISFPQEIWWLIAQELASRGDFGGLFLCARLSKGIALLALPELYAIHDRSPAINAHILDMETSICLWRSIIASSLGKTLFPYCCWIKALRLGNLHSQLEDLARDNPGLKAQFFSPPLEKLQIRQRGRALNLDAIIVEVANLVTACIKNSADQEHKRVGITLLEGYYLPTANLPTWVSSLSSLTMLSVRDGSVLNSGVARAIRANCPAFRHVECFYCCGTDVDEQIAGFFSNLEPHSLVSFTVLSTNEIGSETFKSLCEHSRSLTSLGLFSLKRPALESLNELQHCLSLESLKLEAGWGAQRFPWETNSKQCFQEVIQWLVKCTSLKDLEIETIPASTTILAEILKSPNIHLHSLSLRTLDFDKEFCASLAKQQRLRDLSIRFDDEELLELSEERRAILADAIACCHELRHLDTNELFTFEDIKRMFSSLLLLEDIILYGDLIDDVFFSTIAPLSKLKSLNVYGPSIISPDVLLEFLDQLEADPQGDHEGLQVYLANQDHDFKFTDEEEVRVSTEFYNRFKGRFDINYRMDPDELHESDFSD